MLNDTLTELWQDYERAEARSPRAEKLRALNAFLEALEASPGEDWFPWARSVAERVVDRGEEIAVRMPLFRGALFPALLAGYRAAVPGCARWLAGLAQHLYRCRECWEQLPEDARTDLGLWRAALRHDRGDRASRQRLIRATADRLRFTLHELPVGVLYGMDGATPEQCLELQAWLEEFEGWVAEENLQTAYQDLIARCGFHFAAYRDYLLNRAGYQTYQDYLREKESDRSGPGTG